MKGDICSSYIWHQMTHIKVQNWKNCVSYVYIYTSHMKHTVLDLNVYINHIMFKLQWTRI